MGLRKGKGGGEGVGKAGGDAPFQALNQRSEKASILDKG